jgi:hypothetical protein
MFSVEMLQTPSTMLFPHPQALFSTFASLQSEHSTHRVKEAEGVLKYTKGYVK